ncbi:hypothetical protein PHMEG_0008121 [Phytophthora megakarya]|uniref:TFIIS N-terminal domain-containing protein n=1 Tax=Phytophthora megakarya TaxID=4795 RepID=A0A225WKD4_9STRA|nr:hypothetical protein PHMEG_0008121 [Phytophthora megakarya]
MREPQRFPLGTRVANLLEGRTGEIKAYDPDTGLYSLVYHDGHRDELPANQAEKFVIRKSPKEVAEEQAKKQKEKESDPNQFLGATVTKSSTSYEGKKLTSSGQVTQYFPDIKRFRVLFTDGLYSDMTFEEVKQNVKETAESESQRKRSGGPDGAQSPKKKKSKHHHEEKERPLNMQKFDSRKTAYTMCREILGIILSQKKVAKFCTEKQKVILNNKDLQPKRALEGFVEADGLHALEKMLSQWFRLDTTRSASLLVMKALAIMPGVKEEHLRKTNIARTLRNIEKLSHGTSQIDDVHGDLAEWIIKKWARTAMNRTFNRSARDLLLEQRAQISRASTDGKVHIIHRPASKLTPQQKETARLEALRTGTENNVEDEIDPGEEVVVYLPQFNSLGSEDMRRPVRQIEVIESLASKINREYEDTLKKHNAGDGEEKDDGVTPGRMRFKKPQLMQFSQHIPVANLFATTRSKIVGSNGGGGSTDNTAASTGVEGNGTSPKPLPLPNKTKAPKKSILKHRDEVLTPASQVIWN